MYFELELSILKVIYTHQPLSMALSTIQIQELDSYRLGLQTWPKLIVDEPFMDRAESTFSEKVIRRETLGYHFKLRECEHVEIRPGKRYGEIFRKCRAGIT